MPCLRRTALSASLLTTTLVLAACGGGNGEAAPTEGGATGGGATGGQTYQIGITQIVSHPSLDEARAGFKESLQNAGVQANYDEQNAQGDQATATSVANNFRTKDLVLAIATPTAQAAAQAITDKPIVITAVTDPVEAGLVKSLDAPGGNVTGTTDLNPVDQQLQLLKEINPQAKSVGIVYSSGEVNSKVQVDLARKAAKPLGLSVSVATVSNSSEVAQAAQTLDVDSYYIPTDNTVVSAIESLLGVAESKKVPTIAAEGDSVKRGATATYGIDYRRLGQQTGDMAVRILRDGADPATMPIEKQEKLELVVNPAAAQRAGITIPQGLVDRADDVIK